jgi:cytochrome c-type biogenesis protein CcmH
MRPGTWLLWFGPFLVLFVGIGIIFMIVRKRSAAMPVIKTQEDNGQEW